ncbi:MAG: hypothetical protein JXA22_03565 [Candidatus Thermoplasmatota archaeon]|nr:hypothetical protein [Candidatus Thermoplasmatota archaeon]
MERTSEDEEGLQMIQTAEGLDLGLILEVAPRDNGLIPMFKPAEGRANYISKENLDHYSGHITELEGSHTFGHYTMRYSATEKLLKVVVLRLRSGEDPDLRASGLYFNGRHISFGGGVVSNMLYNNGSNLVRIDMDDAYYCNSSVEIEYDNCHVIEMWLDYSARPKPDEGGGFEMKQFIILDGEGSLQFFYNTRIDTGTLEDWVGAPW